MFIGDNELYVKIGKRLF